MCVQWLASGGWPRNSFWIDVLLCEQQINAPHQVPRQPPDEAFAHEMQLNPRIVPKVVILQAGLK